MSETDSTPVTDAASQDVDAGPGIGEAVETFSREYVEELRRENAKHRNEKKTAFERAKAQADSEWAAKVEAAETETARVTKELGDAWVEIAKVYAAIDAGVPSQYIKQFAGLLKGTTEEEISESATAAKELFGGFETKQPPFDPSQGFGGKRPLPLNGDPILNAVKDSLKIR